MECTGRPSGRNEAPHMRNEAAVEPLFKFGGTGETCSSESMSESISSLQRHRQASGSTKSVLMSCREPRPERTWLEFGGRGSQKAGKRGGNIASAEARARSATRESMAITHPLCFCSFYWHHITFILLRDSQVFASLTGMCVCIATSTLFHARPGRRG